ncbi:hypothetical protein FRB99_004055 [Tulasnella sp. 403]|nr:hypothetical protein FRB99_004055 [Tulasnella sp. 403]
MKRLLSGKEKALAASLATFEKLVQFAAAAQIPIGGGAFNIGKELFALYRATTDNRETCAELLVATAAYAETIYEFATFARNAIANFSKDLGDAQNTMRRIASKGRLASLLLSSENQLELANCQRRITLANQRFNSAVLNILVANTQDALPGQTKNAKIEEETGMNITGTRQLTTPPEDLPSYDVRFVGNVLPDCKAGFWTNLQYVEVNGLRKITKLCYGGIDGERAFLEELGKLGETQ